MSSIEGFDNYIEGFDNYIITDDEDTTIFDINKGYFINDYINGTTGYRCVYLMKDGEKKQKKVHRLLAQTFIDNPENKPCVDHINHNRLDNRLCNLRWVTSLENNHNQSLSKRNTLGYQGITLTKYNTYRATININKKTKSKTFKTLEEAIRWRNEMVKIHYPSRPSIES